MSMNIKDKLREFLNSGVTSLSIGLISSIAAIYSINVNIAFMLFVLLVVTAYVWYILFDYYKQLRWRKNIMKAIFYESVSHEWSINEIGDFHLKAVYVLKNSSTRPISVIPEDNGYWYSKPSNVSFECSIIDQDAVHHAIVEYQNNLIEKIGGFLGKPVNYLFAWKHTLTPPIMPGERVTLSLSIHTKETEKDAFSTSGTFAGIPANLPTNYVKLAYSAPIGYAFELIPPVQVFDSNMQIDVEESKNLVGPSLSHSNRLISWELRNLKLSNRYLFKYRLAKDI